MRMAHQAEGLMRIDGELEAEVAQANLSLYVQLTPMEAIQWPQVAAALERLDRLREGTMKRAA